MMARQDGERFSPTMAPDQVPASAEALFDVLGYRVRVSVPDPIARQQVWPILSGFGPVAGTPADRVVPYALTRDGAAVWTVRARGAVLHTGTDLTAAVAALEWHILTDALARRRDHFHLHGAAVAPPDGGDGVVLLGDSGSGKTTLTLGLMLRGCLPLSDDVTLLEPLTLAAQPVRRAFHLEAGTRRLLEERALPASWDLDAAPPGYFLPLRWAGAPVPIRYVLFPSYQPGAAPLLTRLAIPDAAATLLGQTTSLVRVPQLALATVARLTARAQCYHFVSGDLDEALDAILALLATQARAEPAR